jgi:hypothetical protein
MALMMLGTEMHITEPLGPEPVSFKVEIITEKLKRCKSLGTDQIPTELIQAGGNTLFSEIHKLRNYIWNKEELPQQWKESTIVPIYKKGVKTDCGNGVVDEYHCYQLHIKFYPIFLS